MVSEGEGRGCRDEHGRTRLFKIQARNQVWICLRLPLAASTYLDPLELTRWTSYGPPRPPPETAPCRADHLGVQGNSTLSRVLHVVLKAIFPFKQYCRTG
jgi:hypothetical protein